MNRFKNDMPSIGQENHIGRYMEVVHVGMYIPYFVFINLDMSCRLKCVIFLVGF